MMRCVTLSVLGAIGLLACAGACDRSPGVAGISTPAAAAPAPARWSDPILVQKEGSRGAFICPMFCENDPQAGPRTHAEKGECSVCKMDLEPVADLAYEVTLVAAPAGSGIGGGPGTGSSTSSPATDNQTSAVFNVRIFDPLGESVRNEAIAPMLGSAQIVSSDETWKGSGVFEHAQGATTIRLLVPKPGRYLVSGTLVPPKESGRGPSPFVAGVTIEEAPTTAP